MVDSHGDPGVVVGQVVDSVGNGLTIGLIRKVVGRHIDRFALWVPFFAGLGEPSDEFLIFCIDADHRAAGGQELSGQLVDVTERCPGLECGGWSACGPAGPRHAGRPACGRRREPVHGHGQSAGCRPGRCAGRSPTIRSRRGAAGRSVRSCRRRPRGESSQRRGRSRCVVRFDLLWCRGVACSVTNRVAPDPGDPPLDLGGGAAKVSPKPAMSGSCGGFS
jgi:hypothetical protein